MFAKTWCPQTSEDVSNLLELELQTVVSGHVGLGAISVLLNHLKL